MTSRNICLTNEFPDADFYKVICDCGSDDHNQTLELNVEDGTIYLHLYQKAFTKHVWCPTERFEFIEDWKTRFRTAWIILTQGYAEYETEFIFQNEEGIEDYINAMKNSLEKMKKQREIDEQNYIQKNKDEL